jgi:hypothetical protein
MPSNNALYVVSAVQITGVELYGEPLLPTYVLEVFDSREKACNWVSNNLEEILNNFGDDKDDIYWFHLEERVLNTPYKGRHIATFDVPEKKWEDHTEKNEVRDNSFNLANKTGLA